MKRSAMWASHGLRRHVAHAGFRDPPISDGGAVQVRLPRIHFHTAVVFEYQ